MKKQPDIPGVNFAAYTLQTFSALFFTQFLYLLVSIITARVLGPSGKGTVAILNLYPTVLFTIVHLSIYRVLTVYVAEKKYPFRYFPATVLAYIFIISTIVAAIFLFAYFHWNRFFIQGVNFSLILLSIAMLPFIFINQTFSSMLEVKGRINRINFKEVLGSIILLSLIAFVLLVLKRGVGGTVFSYFVTNLTISCLLIYFVFKISPERWRFDFSLLKGFIKDGTKLHIAVIANFISLRIDMLMLGYFRQSKSVGYYSIAVSILELLFLISIATQTIFYSKLIDLVKDKQEMGRKIVLIYKHSLVIFTAAVILSLLFSRPMIIFFYGRAFLPSLNPLLILLPGAYLLYLHNIFVNYLVGMKKFFLLSVVFSICSFLNVFLNLILIPRYDVSGAALSSTITYSLQSICAVIIFFAVAKISLRGFFKGLRFESQDFGLYKVLAGKLLSRITR